VAILYILWFFGIIIPFLVCCTKKNLATLLWIGSGLTSFVVDLLSENVPGLPDGLFSNQKSQFG
jgi:hypothetical protein